MSTGEVVGGEGGPLSEDDWSDVLPPEDDDVALGPEAPAILVFAPCVDLLDSLLLNVACVLVLVERDSPPVGVSSGAVDGGGLVEEDDRQFSTSSTRFESVFRLRRLLEDALNVDEGGKRE